MVLLSTQGALARLATLGFEMERRWRSKMAIAVPLVFQKVKVDPCTNRCLRQIFLKMRLAFLCLEDKI
jgi:hypothetical protein